MIAAIALVALLAVAFGVGLMVGIDWGERRVLAPLLDGDGDA